MPGRYLRRVRRRRNVRRKALRRQARSGKRARGASTGTQTARIVETIEFNDLNANTSYANVFSLSQFARASAVAPNFRWYKPTKVEWIYEPLYNTFQEGSAGTSPSAPYIYTVMNRNGNNHVATRNDIQAMGAKPRKLVGKLTVAYRPNWLSPGTLGYWNYVSGGQGGNYLTNVYVNGLKTEYGWTECPIGIVLNGTAATNTIIAPPTFPQPPAANVANTQSNIANGVMYNGHDLFIDQVNAVAGPVCRLTCTVHWSFKEPMNINNLSDTKQEVVMPMAK